MTGSRAQRERRERRARAFPLCVVLVFLTISVAAPGTETRSGPDAAADASVESAPPTAELKAHAGRILRNFGMLMKNTGKDIGWFAASLLLWSILWGAVLLFSGGVAGFLAYLGCRRKRLFDAPFRWYSYVRWVWAPVFILCVALGSGYSGLWLGGGRTVKQAILQDRILDRVVANMMVAIVLDNAEYEVSGATKSEDIKGVLADSERVAGLAKRDFAAKLDQLAEDSQRNLAQRWLLWLAGSSAADAAADKLLKDANPRMLFAIFASGENIEEYLKAHPDANSAVAALSVHFKAIRRRACGMVNSAVYPNALLGIAFGLGMPLVLLCLFRLALWIHGRVTRPQDMDLSSR
jgi:hypothetical protein